MKYMWLSLLIVLFAISAQAQKMPSWHGQSVPPGSTTPQCIVDHDPDHYGFRPCNVLDVDFTDNFLEHRDVIIWIPPGYKTKPVGPHFWWWFATTVAFGIADEENSQRLIHQAPTCNSAGQCFSYRETNPILGHTRAQAYGIIGGLDLFSFWECRKQRKYVALRQQVGLPPWNKGFWSHVYMDYWWPMVLQDAAHTMGIIRSSHKGL